MEQTLWLFPSSKHLLEKIRERAEDLGFPEISIALSDSAPGAQALTQHFDFFICEPGREKDSLGPLPTSSLRDLEGLTPWEEPAKVEAIADFLATLGLRSFDDLRSLPPESWNLRWGDLGAKLQKKISGRERSVFTPLIPDQPLTAFRHLDFPISNRELLLESMTPALRELLFRLEGREQGVDQVALLLICEYSDHKHKVLISPTHKTRDLNLLLTLLRERFSRLELENPIRDWEIEVTSLAKSAKQLDFWEPPVSESENLLRLQALFHERGLQSGFLKVEPEILPEKSWSLKNEPAVSKLPVTDFAFEETYHRELPVLSQTLNSAPRPTRLLDPPLALSASELQSFRFLHRHPLERLLIPWLKTGRDYWMALNANRQCVWIYKDMTTSDYFLQGYFD